MPINFLEKVSSQQPLSKNELTAREFNTKMRQLAGGLTTLCNELHEPCMELLKSEGFPQTFEK